VDVRIPGSFGGLGGEALFIDTDSGFVPERLKGEPIRVTEKYTFSCGSLLLSQSNEWL
jgi:hypothetical protein